MYLNLAQLLWKNRCYNGANVDWIKNNNDFSIRAELNSGETVYLAVGAYGDGALSNVKAYVAKES